jgi:hypothetical protein
MIGNWRDISFEANSIVEECSFFNHNKVFKPIMQFSEPKKHLEAISKKKIKCP